MAHGPCVARRYHAHPGDGAAVAARARAARYAPACAVPVLDERMRRFAVADVAVAHRPDVVRRERPYPSELGVVADGRAGDLGPASAVPVLDEGGVDDGAV